MVESQGMEFLTASRPVLLTHGHTTNIQCMQTLRPRVHVPVSVYLYLFWCWSLTVTPLTYNACKHCPFRMGQMSTRTCTFIIVLNLVRAGSLTAGRGQAQQREAARWPGAAGGASPGRSVHSDTALYTPFVILHRTYTGWCGDDFNVCA